MTTIVDRYIGSNGDVLIPITSTTDNTSNLISIRGVYYLAQTHEVVTIVTGNPMGLLLTLTYASTP